MAGNEVAGAPGLRARLATATTRRPVALGRYDVVGQLGQGGMGTVYEAVDRERDTRVALKSLIIEDAEGVLQLKREFRIVADVTHPNLAPVYELACVDGLWFFTMQHIDGVDFTSWVRGGPDPYAEAACVGAST